VGSEIWDGVTVEDREMGVPGGGITMDMEAVPGGFVFGAAALQNGVPSDASAQRYPESQQRPLLQTLSGSSHAPRQTGSPFESTLQVPGEQHPGDPSHGTSFAGQHPPEGIHGPPVLQQSLASH
jgi:hypothetical protein